MHFSSIQRRGNYLWFDYVLNIRQIDFVEQEIDRQQ